MASRKLSDLTPEMQHKAQNFYHAAYELGLTILIYCTYRSLEEQAILFRQSRTLTKIQDEARNLEYVYKRADLAEILLGVGPQSGPHVTNASPGKSMHNYKMAFDGVPLVAGKPVWGAREIEDNRMWNNYGHAAEEAGLEWAGNWKAFKEYPHCQMPEVDWRDLIKNG